MHINYETRVQSDLSTPRLFSNPSNQSEDVVENKNYHNNLDTNSIFKTVTDKVEELL